MGELVVQVNKGKKGLPIINSYPEPVYKDFVHEISGSGLTVREKGETFGVTVRVHHKPKGPATVLFINNRTGKEFDSYTVDPGKKKYLKKHGVNIKHASR